MTPPLSSGQRDSSSFLPAVCVFAECRTSKVRCNYEMPCARCIKLGLECKVPPTVKRGRPPKAFTEARKAGRVLPEAASEPAAPEPAAPARSARAASGSQRATARATSEEDTTHSTTKEAGATEAERVTQLNMAAACLASNLWGGEQQSQPEHRVNDKWVDGMMDMASDLISPSCPPSPPQTPLRMSDATKLREVSHAHSWCVGPATKHFVIAAVSMSLGSWALDQELQRHQLLSILRAFGDFVIGGRAEATGRRLANFAAEEEQPVLGFPEASWPLVLFTYCLIPGLCALLFAAVAPDGPQHLGRRPCLVFHAVNLTPIIGRASFTVRFSELMSDIDGAIFQGIRRAILIASFLTGVARLPFAFYRGGVHFWASLRVSYFLNFLVLLSSSLFFGYHGEKLSKAVEFGSISWQKGLAISASMLAVALVLNPANRRRAARACGIASRAGIASEVAPKALLSVPLTVA